MARHRPFSSLSVQYSSQIFVPDPGLILATKPPYISFQNFKHIVANMCEVRPERHQNHFTPKSNNIYFRFYLRSFLYILSVSFSTHLRQWLRTAQNFFSKEEGGSAAYEADKTRSHSGHKHDNLFYKSDKKKNTDILTLNTRPLSLPHPPPARAKRRRRRTPTI